MSLQVGLSIPAFSLALGDGRCRIPSQAGMLAGYKSTAGMETEFTNPVRDRTERKMILYCVMFEGNYCNCMTDQFHEIQRILRHT